MVTHTWAVIDKLQHSRHRAYAVFRALHPQAAALPRFTACGCRQRYTNLHGVMERMHERQREKEAEEWERNRSWGYLLLQSSKAVGCVALGAFGVITLIGVCEGREGLRALSTCQ